LAEASARIGPEPTEEIDRQTWSLLAGFNAARGSSTDPLVGGPLAEPLRSHYRALVEPVWQLMGRVVARERQLSAAPSVSRRFEADREAFGRHVDWVVPGGYYRTTDTPRQAAITLRRLEDALAHYEADRAVEDPACTIPLPAGRGRDPRGCGGRFGNERRRQGQCGPPCRDGGGQPGPGNAARRQAPVVDGDRR
jgi:hypothetical protein